MFDDGSSGSHGMRANRTGAGLSMNFLDETIALAIQSMTQSGNDSNPKPLNPKP